MTKLDDKEITPILVNGQEVSMDSTFAPLLFKGDCVCPVCGSPADLLVDENIQSQATDCIIHCSNVNCCVSPMIPSHSIKDALCSWDNMCTILRKFKSAIKSGKLEM